MPRTISKLAILAIMIIARTSVGAEREYQVKLHRPYKVGEAYDYTASAKVHRQISGTMDGRAMPEVDETFEIRLQAKAEVLQVNEKGGLLKATFTIGRLTKTKEGREQEVLPKGARVPVEARMYETIFKLEDGQLSEDQDECLTAVIYFDTRNDDEKVLEPVQAQRIGATWPVNAKALADSLSKQGVPCREEEVSGTVQLVGTEKVNGKDYLKVSYTLRLTNPALPRSEKHDPTPGEKVLSLDNRMSNTVLIPLDTDANELRTASDARMDVSGEAAPEQGAVKWTSRIEHRKEVVMTPAAR